MFNCFYKTNKKESKPDSINSVIRESKINTTQPNPAHAQAHNTSGYGPLALIGRVNSEEEEEESQNPGR